MTTDLFRSLRETLSKTLTEVDIDLTTAEDIQTNLELIDAFADGAENLPVTCAKLEAKKASIEATLPDHEAAVTKAKHAVTLIEAKLKKLCQSLERNRAALADEKPASTREVQALSGLNLPVSRQAYVDELLAEIAAAEAELVQARGEAKKAKLRRGGIVGCVASLDKRIVETRKAVVANAAHHGEVIKVLRKTISHLRNRQEKRDRKRAQKTVTVPGFENADGSPIEFVDVRLDPLPKCAPTDEDIRKLAESHGLHINGPEDLEAARQLFLT